MKFFLNGLISVFFLFPVVALHAADVKVGEIALVAPHIRAMNSNAQVTSGYLQIHNQGAEPDQLLKAHSPQATRIEIHEMRVENDVMRMRPLEQGLELPAGAIVSLAPGGYHLMIFEPTAPLIAGEIFPIELHFAKAGTMSVDFAIKAIGKGKEATQHHDHQHDHNHDH